MKRTETYWRAASRILGERIRKFVQMCRKTAAHATADNIHDLRVAARRLAAAQVVFDMPELAGLKRESRVIRRRLGELRDLDVAVANIRKLMKGQEWEREIEGWLKGLSSRRRKLLAATRPLLRISIVRVPVAVVRGDTRPFLSYAPDHLRPLVDAARGLLASLRTSDDAQEIHKLRVKIKRIRYTLELFGHGFDPRAEEWLAACKRLQDGLGVVHDHDLLVARVEREWERRLGAQDGAAAAFEALLNEAWRARHRLYGQLIDTLSDRFLEDIAARLVPAAPVVQGVSA